MSQPNTIASIASGALFGAALSAAGVASPSVILSQLRIENFHMFEVFLTATGCSALITYLSRRLAPSTCSPRTPSPLGYFPYDGNIIGSLLLGLGMSLTGSCPGTVMVQVGMGLRSGYFVLAGSLVGGVLYSAFGHLLKSSKPAQKGEEKEKPKATLYEALNTSELLTALAFTGAMLTLSTTALRLLPSAPTPPFLNPLVGGLLMASSQAASLILTKNTLGVSGAYSTFGAIVLRLKSMFLGNTPSHPAEGSKWPAMRPIFFTSGVALGSYIFWTYTGGSAPELLTNGPGVSDTKAIIGGLLMAFGSRVAGGCTSGHGISGMSGLSLASFVSVAGMFGGGMAGAAVWKALGL